MVKSKLATQTNGITRQRMGSFRKHSNHIGHHRTANSKSMDHPPLSDPSPPRSNKVTSTSTVTNPHVLANQCTHITLEHSPRYVNIISTSFRLQIHLFQTLFHRLSSFHSPRTKANWYSLPLSISI
jgi:hypothetical protein